MNKQNIFLFALLLTSAGLCSPPVKAENITDGLPKISAEDIAKWHGIYCFIIDLPEDIEGKVLRLYTTDQDGKELKTSGHHGLRFEPGERIKLLMKLDDDRNIKYQFITKLGSSGPSTFEIDIPKKGTMEGEWNDGRPHASGKGYLAKFYTYADKALIKVHFEFMANPAENSQ